MKKIVFVLIVFLFVVSTSASSNNFVIKDINFNKEEQIINKLPKENALTYKIKNPRGEPMNHYKYTLKKPPKNPSTYQVDYCKLKSDCHLGMDNKPLIPYDATHKRSQLPEDLKFKVFRNMSKFDIGNDGLVNRKQWVSTYADSYQPIKTYYISNPGKYFAEKIHDFKTKKLIRIIVSRSEDILDDIKDSYKELYNTELIDDIKNNTDNDFQLGLVTLIEK